MNNLKEKIVKKSEYSENTNIDLSIILPVYNVEKYLKRCIESIISKNLNKKHTKYNFEIIIVNDGSKDESYKIIEEYIKIPEITYVIKENGGLSDARNVGHKYARGKYVTYFDSDDYIQEDMYINMLKKAYEGNFDIVATSLFMEYENTGKIKKVEIGIQKDFDRLDVDIATKKQIMENIYVAVHNKIYKKELVDKVFSKKISDKTKEEVLPFVKGMNYEDIAFTYSIMRETKSIGYIETPSYYYVQRPGSISNKYGDDLYNIPKSIDIIIERYKKSGKYEQFKDILEYIATRYMHGTFLLRMCKTGDLKKVIKAYNYSRQELGRLFPEYKKNLFLNSNSKSKNLKKKIYNNIYKNMNQNLITMIFYAIKFGFLDKNN